MPKPNQGEKSTSKELMKATTGESIASHYAEFNIEVYKNRVADLLSNQSRSKEQTIELAILQAAVAWEMPAYGITILGGHPYKNTAGLLFMTKKMEKDFGPLKAIRAFPMVSDGKPMVAQKVGDTAIFVGQIVFKGKTKQGEVIFEDVGEASPSNIKMSTIRPFANSMAARRATNRAMRLATQSGETSYEEVSDSEIEDEVSGDNNSSIPLTENQNREIIDEIAMIDGITNKEELEAARKRLSEIKAKLHPKQVQYLAALFQRKVEMYNNF